jgi:multidrug efflux system membrane fusion protein
MRRRLWQIGAAAAIAAFLMMALCKPPAKQSGGRRGLGANQPVSVVMAGVRKGDIRIFVDGIGSVAALSTVTVRSQVDGQLISVNFKEGQNVSKGSLLAIIDPRAYEALQAQAAGQLQRDQALLANARQDLERYDTLWSQNAIPRQQYDTQRSLVAQLEGTVMIDQGALANAKLQVTYTRITSPINGRVGLKFVDAGNIVHSTDANGLAVVTQLQPITVIFTIPEDNLPPVLDKFRRSEGLSVFAFNRNDSVKIADGRLLAVDNRIDTATGTVRLKAVFPNTGNELFPNQFVNARLLLEVKHDEVIIPQAALQRGPQSTFVYLVKQDHTVSVVPVTAGLTEGDNISIDSGLSEGDTVVVEGADRLREGSIVESIVPSAAAGRPEHAPGRAGRPAGGAGAGQKR